MALVALVALPFNGGLVTRPLFPECIDRMTFQAKFRRTLDQVMLVGIAVGIMTGNAVQAPGRFVADGGIEHLFLVPVAGETKLAGPVLLQESIVSGMGIMAPVALTLPEWIMPAGRPALVFEVCMASVAQSGLRFLEQPAPLAAVHIVACRAAARCERCMLARLSQIPAEPLVASQAKFLLPFDQNAVHGALMHLMAVQASTCRYGRMGDRTGLKDFGMTLDAQFFRRPGKQIGFTGRRNVGPMAVEAFSLPSRLVRGSGSAGPTRLFSHILEFVTGKAKGFRDLSGHSTKIRGMRVVAIGAFAVRHRCMHAFF